MLSKYSRLFFEGFFFLLWIVLWAYVLDLNIASNLMGLLFGLIVIRAIFNWYYAGKYT